MSTFETHSTGDVRAAELRHRVVPVADEDALEELRRTRALDIVVRARPSAAGSESANSSRNIRRSVP